MSNIFITGDRKFSPVYLPLVYDTMLTALAKGDTISTGNQGGVEEVVRVVAERNGVTVQVIEATTGEDGKVDHVARAKSLAHPSSGVDEIVAVHADPLTSSVIRALLDHADDKTRLTTVADLIG